MNFFLSSLLKFQLLQSFGKTHKNRRDLRQCKFYTNPDVNFFFIQPSLVRILVVADGEYKKIIINSICNGSLVDFLPELANDGVFTKL